MGRDAYPAPGSAGRPGLGACAQNGTWVIPERARRARVLGHLPGARIAGSACALHLPAARSVWPLTNDLGALDLSARSGADRVHDADADQTVRIPSDPVNRAAGAASLRRRIGRLGDPLLSALTRNMTGER